MVISRRALYRLPPVPPDVKDNTQDEEHADTDLNEFPVTDRDTRRRPDRTLSGPKLAADRWRRIAVAAYLRAERRGFAGDAELQDWLAAEREVDEQLAMESFETIADTEKKK